MKESPPNSKMVGVIEHEKTPLIRNIGHGKTEEIYLPNIKDRFLEITLSTINSFYLMKMILNDFPTVFSYRGQNDISWPLKTKIERAYDAWNEKDNKSIHALEKHIINSFKRKNPEIWNIFALGSIVALLQHYGQPTRLLDFTQDFLIAMFFALEEDFTKHEYSTDSVIWAVRNIDINSSINLEFFNNRIEDADVKGDYLQDAINGRIEKKIVRIISVKSKNPRISVQKGCFLCPSNLNFNFETNFFGNFGLENWDLHKKIIDYNQNDKFEDIKDLVKTSFILKIIIPIQIKNHIINYLNLQGYIHTNMYPSEPTLYESLDTVNQ